MHLSWLKLICLMGILSLGCLLWPGCAEQEEKKEKVAKERPPADSIQHGGTYRFPLMNNPATLDPAYIQDKYGVSVAQQLFDGLVQFDPYLMVAPALAETWQVEENGKVYRFILRKNALFHNGQPVTVEDVVFSISRLLRANPPPAILPHLLKIEGAPNYRNHESDRVQGLEPVDEHVLRIRLKEPHTPFLTALGMYQAKIVPKAEIARSGDPFERNPVGTGPFRFVAWEPDKLIRLKRFADYYAGAAFLDEIHYPIYGGDRKKDVLPDFQKRVLQEMPVYGNVRDELSADSSLQWFHRPSLSLFFYGINCRHPHLKHPDLRKALFLATDRKKLVDDVYKSQFEIARTILPPGMPGYRPKNEVTIYDISLAQQHLKHAFGEKRKSFPPIEIVSAHKSQRVQQEMDILRETWGQLGIPIEIKYITDWKAFKAYLKSDALQVYRYAWFADLPDPDNFLYPLFASTSPNNFMHYQNKEVDQMLLTARGIVDPVERAEMYRRIETLALESSPLIPLFYLSVDRVYQSTVQGAQPNALGSHTMPLHRVWLKAPSSK